MFFMNPSKNYKKEEEELADHKICTQNERNDDTNMHSVADRVLRRPHYYFEKIVWACIRMQTTGLILDYGCGNGMRTRKFVQHGWQLYGIDISAESIRIAKRDSAEEGLQAQYYIMDGENMTFLDNQFDLILDYGVFSSVDMKKAVPDLLRVLKPSGTIIAIETLGHNPIFNIKRKLNVLRGIRTSWSKNHIMKLSDWAKLKNNFSICKIKFFGVTTALIAPLIWCLPRRLQNNLITFCEKIDNYLLKSDMMKPWAFKTVVQLSKPI